MRKESITQAELKELLDYDPETGVFRWKVCRGGKRIGQIAGCLHHSGYIYIEINEKPYGAHRLAWLYLYGELPELEVDHEHGLRCDNRAENLRLASDAQQAQNKAVYKNSTTKLPGVGFHKMSGKYSARLTVDGKDLWLGLFDTIEEAWEARVRAKEKYHSFQPVDRDACLARAVQPERDESIKRSANPTGVKGVTHVPQIDAYRVRFRVDGKLKSYGIYKTLEEAKIVSDRVRAELGR